MIFTSVKGLGFGADSIPWVLRMNVCPSACLPTDPQRLLRHVVGPALSAAASSLLLKPPAVMITVWVFVSRAILIYLLGTKATSTS